MMRTIDAFVVALLAGSAVGCNHRAERIGLKLIQPANIAANEQVGEVVDMGRRHLDDRNFALAISQFREALRLDPQDAAAHNGLAIAYTSIGRTDLARRHFERAVAYGPADQTYQRNYARFLGTIQAGAEAALAQASTDGSPQDGTAVADAVGSGQLPAPPVRALDERSRSQGPILMDASGVAMLLSRPRPTGGHSAKSEVAKPAGRQAAGYDLAAFGLAPTPNSLPPGAPPLLQRASLYEVRLVTVAASLRAGASKAAPAASVAKYSSSLAEASLWGAVDRARARVRAARSAADLGECAGGSGHVPRWAARITVQIRQCSA